MVPPIMFGNFKVFNNLFISLAEGISEMNQWSFWRISQYEVNFLRPLILSISQYCKILCPIAVDESYSSNASENEEGKSFSAAVTPAQLPEEMREGDGGDHASGIESTSATPATSSPSTMRLSSSCPLTEKMSWAISDRSLQVCRQPLPFNHPCDYSHAPCLLDLHRQICPGWSIGFIIGD